MKKYSKSKTIHGTSSCVYMYPFLPAGDLLEADGKWSIKLNRKQRKLVSNLGPDLAGIVVDLESGTLDFIVTTHENNLQGDNKNGR